MGGDCVPDQPEENGLNFKIDRGSAAPNAKVAHPAYTDPVCRGSYLLGTNCGRCERCVEQKEKLFGRGQAEKAAKKMAELEANAARIGHNVLFTAIPVTEACTVTADDITVTSDSTLQVKPRGEEVIGLPVPGYEKTQPAWALGLVRQNKVIEEVLERQLDTLQERYSADVDQRDVARARTLFTQAFTMMNRAVFQPERILSGPDSDLAIELLTLIRGEEIR